VSAPGPVADSVTGAYRAATQGTAFLDRSARTRLTLGGRAPEQVLSGLVTGKVPAPLEPAGAGLLRGRAEWSALLTPKGKMIAELRILRAGPAPEDGFLVDLPTEPLEATLAHLRMYVPPRMARVEDVSAATGMLTLLGPAAPALLARVLGAGVDPEALRAMREGDLLHSAGPSGDLGDWTVLCSGEVATPALDVLLGAEALGVLAERLTEGGAEAVTDHHHVWEALRVEAGRPAWGQDMDETTIPIEAGIHPRVVDYTKGCFTGQEVLIRIRDRGHVNRLLRGLVLGDGPVPERGAPLFRAGEERSVGHVTSAVRSPRAGQVIGIGLVRREVEPPAELRLGAPDGATVGVRVLGEGWAVGGASD